LASVFLNAPFWGQNDAFKAQNGSFLKLFCYDYSVLARSDPKGYMSKDIKQFIRENEALFWGVKPEERENISLNVLVETILNYGNEKRVKTLFDIIGVKTVADIFFRQISGKRSNYHQRTKHFFQLYFKRHAQ
jgi:hypothetical protein